MYSNKRVKALLESLTPDPADPWMPKELPWNKYDMFDPTPIREKQRHNRILRKLKKLLGPAHYDELIDYMRGCGNTWNYQITFHRLGSYQDEGGEHVNDVWISQSCGMAGDDYSGEIYVKITPKRYFYFEFAC